MQIEINKHELPLKNDSQQQKIQNHSPKYNKLHSNNEIKIIPSTRRSILFDKIDLNNHNKVDEFQKLINIMLKHHRSMIEIHLLANYLGLLEELTKFFKSAHENYHELLVTTSCFLRHEFTKKNRILFKFGNKFDIKLGDKSAKFYIILRGSISVLKPAAIRLDLNEEEFILYLINLKKYSEFEILFRCIKENKNIFTEEDFEIWLKNDKKMDKNGKFYHKYFAKNEITQSVDDCSKYIEERRGKEENVNFKEYVDRIKTNNFVYPKTNSEKISFFIYQYERILIFGAGLHFGDIALVSHSQKRTATIITNEDTDFGTLDKVSFDLSLKEVNEKQKKQGLEFFLSTRIFFRFNREIFENKISHLFVIKKINRNEKLYIQGEDINQIFFVKKGDFELTARNSLMEFNNYYKYFGGLKFKSLLEIYEEKQKMEGIFFLILGDPKFNKYLNNKITIKVKKKN